MHQHIQKLHNIASKQHRTIMGLMSGTSLDGLDIAICKISGHGTNTIVNIEAFTTLPYDQEYKTNVRKIFARKQGSIQDVCLLNAWVGNYHAKLIKQYMQEQGYGSKDIDIIASHGQTIYHCPIQQHQISTMPNATLQIGDGDHIAVGTGVITLSDFRQKHIAAGGQGAPLVTYGDYLLFHAKHENRVLLNIGGIANLTYLPQSGDLTNVFSSDIGPGNTMMDGYMQQQYTDRDYDENAQVALSGKCNANLLKALKEHAFFSLPFPKTTGPEVFNLAYLKQAIEKTACKHLSTADVMATLCHFSSDIIEQSIHKITAHFTSQDKLAIYVSGGGMHNPLLMQLVTDKLVNAHSTPENARQISLGTTQLLSLNPDAKEAVLFALLANETLCGNKQTFQSAGPNLPSVSMGKISFPD